MNSNIFGNDFVFCGLMEDRDFCKEILEVLFPITIKNLEIERFDDGRFGDGVRCLTVIEESDEVLEIILHNRLKDNVDFFSEDFKSSGKVDKIKRHEIFLCLTDPFGFVVPAYSLDERIIFNAAAWEYCNNERLSALLKYLFNRTCSDYFTEWIDRRVKEYLALNECTSERDIFKWKERYDKLLKKQVII